MPASKFTILEIFNQIWTNLGETKITLLSEVSNDPDMLRLFDDINIYSNKIAIMYPWKILKPNPKASITLASGINHYAAPEGMYNFDPNSFRLDTNRKVEYVEETDWEEKVSDDTTTGSPIYIKYDGTYFWVAGVPTGSDVGKKISFVAYILPDDFEISEPTATSWFPAPFDREVLCEMVTYKRQRARLDSEAVAYFSEVMGGNSGTRKFPGMMLRMKKAYADVFRSVVDTVNSRYPRGTVSGNSDYGRSNR